MNIVEPSVELWIPENNKQHVAKCARVCYGKETGNDDNTIKHLLACKHLSMFRHESNYFIIPMWGNREAYNLAKKYNQIIQNYKDNIDKESNKVCGIDVKYAYNEYYVVVNGQWRIEHPKEFDILSKHQVSEAAFAENETGFNMMRYTFACITQISTSRELNRVSPNNIAESSTRYIYEDGSIVRPHWITYNDIDTYYNNNEFDHTNKAHKYLNSCEDSISTYISLINNKVPKQDARGVLSLDTKTKVVYTYSIDEWREILNLRYYGTTGKPHPNAKIIAGIIKDKLAELGYDFN